MWNEDMTEMPTAHLICGSTGAGKTTYALALAEREQALRLTVDEWMAGFFWPDAPREGVYDWALERVARCERQALALAGQMLSLGRNLILDYGFFKREQRRRLRDALSAQGWQVRLHYLDVPAEERWRRVAQRNADESATFALEVTRDMFDFCEDLFELPADEELQGAVVAGGD